MSVPYVMFRAALDGGHLDRVLSLARETDAPMKLEDALRVVLLLRDGDADRYRRACLKWIARFVLEARGVTLEDVSEVVEGLALLPTNAADGMVLLQSACLARRVVSCPEPRSDRRARLSGGRRRS